MVLALTEPVLPLEYDLSLQVDHKQPNFKGQLKVLVRQIKTEESFTKFSLNAKDLIVTKATLAGQNLKITYNGDSETVCFVASEEITLAQDADLSISYVGKVNTIRTQHEQTKGLFKTNFMNENTGVSDSFVLATHTQPTFARLIFPCFDEPNSKCRYQLTITTDKRFKVVSNSDVLSRTVDEGKGEQTVKFNRTPLMATSFFGFCIGDLQFLKTDIKLKDSTIPFQLFAPQGISSAAFGLDTVVETLPLVEKRLGCRYPLEKLDIVLLPFLSDMAMENWGLITFQMNHLLLPPYALADSSIRQQVRQLIVHELCHQWMGNYISFDSWDHLWFNEAFATWFACDLLEDIDNEDFWSSDTYVSQIEGVLLADSKLDVKSIATASLVDVKKLQKTNDAFDAHCYNKGISLLRSMHEVIGKKNFGKALEQIFNQEDFHQKCVKPIDIFRRMGEILKSENIPNFFSSWTRTAGYPVVSVTTDKNETKLTQHRYLDEPHSTEDIPYHIAIFGKLTSGELDSKNVLFTDRSIQLPYQLLVINSGFQGLYRVSYESEECFSLICQGLKENKLSEMDILKIFIDLKEFIGGEFQQKCHLDGLVHLLKFIAKELELYGKLLRSVSIGLDILQTIENSLRTYKGQSNESYVTEIYLPMWKKLSWDNFDVPISQLEVMSKVMFGVMHLEDAFIVANKLFRKILTGPNHSVPMELCGSVFSTISFHQKNVKQWKKLYDLVKSAKGIEPHIIGGTYTEIQNLALENLGFNKNEDLLKKVLNFILTNIDCSSVENALFGMNYNSRMLIDGKKEKYVRDICWDWFTLHYDLWVRKSIREGANSSERMRQTLVHISFVIFQMWMDQPEKIDQFVTLKNVSYAKSMRIDQIWDSVKQSETPKLNIYKGILGF